MTSISSQRLQSYINRIERLEEERKALGADVREVYNEAKAAGFDTKIMRKVIAARKLDEAERAEQDALIEVYMRSLGMLADTPLGQSAIGRASAA